MKLRPVTKIEKRTKQRQKKLKMTSFQQLKTSLLFFRFMANLKPSKSPILDAYIVRKTFYLTKTLNRTKKSLRQL